MPLMRTGVVLPTVAPSAGIPAGGAPAAGAPPAPPTPAAETSKPALTPDVSAVLIGYVTIVVGGAAGIGLWSWRNPAGFVPGAGISVFAPLYILAQAIERFLEPFSNLLGATKPDDATLQKDRKRKSDALDEVNRALASGRLSDAANWQRVVDRIRRNTAVIAWGLASAVAMVMCGLFGLFMMRMIGFTAVPKQVDIVISGLAVGSGTKPLHDLIANLQQAKEQKEDPPEKQAA